MAPPTMSATDIEQPSAGPYISFSNTNPAEGHKVQEHKFVEELPVAPKVKSVDEAPEPEQQAPEVREPRVQEVETKEPERSLAFSSEPLPAPPVFEDKYKEREYLKQRLTLAFRVFAKLGFDCGIAGHITLRDPVDPTSFWLNPFGRPWPALESKDLIRVDANGNVVEHGAYRTLNKAAYMIHHAVHVARPEINCVAHAHSTFGKAFSTLGRNLDITTQDHCVFWNDVAHYASFGGAVLGPEEGQNIAKALGNKKAAILQNHGLLTCGQTIEACTWWFMSLENCCQTQLLADAAAAGRGSTTVKVDEEDAEYTWRVAGADHAGYMSSLPMFELVEAASRGYCF